VLEHSGARIVLDLGYGMLPRLLTVLGSSAADGIDAVIVTHAHPGHMVDLHPAVAELGREADHFITDATDRAKRSGGLPAGSGPALNLTAREAG
jgi:glyoxylase-like metal-dependent hydrolase (beta-lactamase superfamily II)